MGALVFAHLLQYMKSGTPCSNPPIKELVSGSRACADGLLRFCLTWKNQSQHPDPPKNKTRNLEHTSRQPRPERFTRASETECRVGTLFKNRTIKSGVVCECRDRLTAFNRWMLNVCSKAYRNQIKPVSRI